MDFSSSTHKNIYGSREVDPTWRDWCLTTFSPKDKDIADIGCGGGIYSRGFVSLGAKSVVGVDRSEQYIEEATNKSPKRGCDRYQIGDAENTGLPASSIDLVFERALIHHMSSEAQKSNLVEAKRILRSGGIITVHDRTYSDILDNNPRHWIRTTLYECHPELLEFERRRRPQQAGYLELLKQQGFHSIEVLKYIETRKEYVDFDDLNKEIMSRLGKSILFQLDDKQLQQYCAKLKKRSTNRELVELDQWTVWLAISP